MVGNKRVRMSMTDAVLEFEMCDLLHMFFIAQLIENLEPVRDRLSIGLLDGRKVGRGSFDLLFTCHAHLR